MDGAIEPQALEVELRDVREDDLPVFFEHQRDPEAHRMAAFPPRDREAFMVHWRTAVLGRPGGVAKTVLFRGQVAGHVVCWEQAGRRLVGYWIGRELWGRGIATRALARLVALVQVRPLHAWVAEHNAGSIRVLEKCGFVPSPGGDGGDGVEERLFTLAR